jgi:hypothetical protein
LADTDFAYALTDHICAACLGRLLVRAGADGRHVFHCSECGAEAEAPDHVDHPPNCACTLKLGARDAGIRCVRNPQRRAELPHQIVAAEIASSR